MMHKNLLSSIYCHFTEFYLAIKQMIYGLKEFYEEFLSIYQVFWLIRDLQGYLGNF